MADSNYEYVHEHRFAEHEYEYEREEMPAQNIARESGWRAFLNGTSTVSIP